MGTWEEQPNNDVMINLLKPENIKRRCEAAVGTDGVVVKQCKNAGKPGFENIFDEDGNLVQINCMEKYSVPTKNPYGRMKLGDDKGLCPVCSGAYDDPEGFYNF